MRLIEIFFLVEYLLFILFIAFESVLTLSEKIPSDDKSGNVSTQINIQAGDGQREININQQPLTSSETIVQNQESNPNIKDIPENSSSNTSRETTEPGNVVTPAPSSESQNISSVSEQTTTVPGYVNDKSNYYRNFVLENDLALFGLLIALACFLVGIGLIKFDLFLQSNQVISS